MPTYATVEDVLRELGGDRPALEQRFDVRKWEDEPVTSVTVDGLTFDMPDSLLTRIAVRIDHASSRLDTAILAAYKATPTAPYPLHLIRAAAVLAAMTSVTTDGTRPDYIRDMGEDVKAYFGKISKMELDLGIEGPRPRHRTPAVFVARGVGGRQVPGTGYVKGPCEC
jgi:hypothetical protein